MATEPAPAFDAGELLRTELLRFTTAGSVDDGKSTLIGRMLYDSKAIFQDQMEALEQASSLRGEDGVNLALLTDGLRAEREQGITIDVAYRYFTTPRRKFIIADTPGHVQYTRNMITGASTADLAIILIDARNGVLPQSRRHCIIASLLGIPHVIVAVNKMDLVDWSRTAYDAIVAEFTDFSSKLDIHDMTFVPISALTGDNVVERSSNMSWYEGPTVLHQLETVTISADRNLVDFRFPVQIVVRPHQDFRGFAGRVASGTIRVGEEILTMPSRTASRIKAIVTADGDLEEAFEGQSVVLTLDDEVDVSRGDMIVRKQNIPHSATRFEATLCWFDDLKSLDTSTPYTLQHTTRNVRAYVRNLRYQLDVNSLHRQPSDTLELNEIGRIEVETASPIFFDSYTRNRETGSFILIDPVDNRTVGAGMVREITRKEYDQAVDEQQASRNLVWHGGEISREDREQRSGHSAAVYWFTGLSGSGKSTIARAWEKKLFTEGKQVIVLDGDNIRHGLNGDLGFAEADRAENVRRVGEVAKLFHEAGFLVLCCFISPRQAMRDGVRMLFPVGAFTEVYVRCDLDECRRRDPKGLYQKAYAGQIEQMTGVGAPYEMPLRPELTLDTDSLNLDECLEKLGESLE